MKNNQNKNNKNGERVARVRLPKGEEVIGIIEQRLVEIKCL